MEDNANATNVDLEQILTGLDNSLVSLKENNIELARNNKDLKKQINEMDSTISKLKKEVRGIWWNGVVDKIVIGALGVGLGFLLGSA